MPTLETTRSRPSSPSVEAAIIGACKRIAPAWPLDRLAAVNPYWGFVDRPVREVAAQIGALAGSRFHMPRAYFRARWEAGAIRAEDLQSALSEMESPLTVDDVRSWMTGHDAPVGRRALVTDLVQAPTAALSPTELVVDAVSRFAALYFDGLGERGADDVGQSLLSPARDGGLYAAWCRHRRRDPSPELALGVDASRLPVFPETARGMIGTALTALSVPAQEHENYLTALLFDVVGWSSYAAYLGWTAGLRGASDTHLEELLAVRLAWEWMLVTAGPDGLSSRFRRAMDTWPDLDRRVASEQAAPAALQRAMERAYQAPLIRGLSARPDRAPVEASAQVAFCIDVRSEVFRRALEKQDESVQTLGFAGFFGMPIDYLPLASRAARPQLPGLLAPRMRVTDLAPETTADARDRRLSLGSTWNTFTKSAVSGFSFVETTGLFYAGKLLSSALGRGRPAAHPESAGLSAKEHETRRPRLSESVDGEPISVTERADLAAGILRAMSLTEGHARVVALIGHGSETVNNPHAAGLDCGACCGQTGEVNARAVAALLNQPEVRAGLRERGISVPEATWFVPGLHNTTTDAVRLFDLDEVPSSHADDVRRLQGRFASAGTQARRERAGRLGLGDLEGEAIDRAIDARARRWSEVRPEWGLTDNAAFVVAPRAHVAHLNLEGRSFLHDYRAEQDTDFAILELIMTAPMVVTHWINFQYYASTVDNRRFGSGNKVLHDVVGGHLGVFEGNGGDLRIGLPMQSVHDGDDWVHTPLRLSVFIEAPQDAIDGVIAKHDTVRQLVDNGWIHLFQLEDGGVARRTKSGWTRA